MQQAPYLVYLLSAREFKLDPSVYHFTIRELLETDSAIGDIAGDISMGQAAIAYHKNILDDSSDANSNIKHQDIYQAEAESIKAKARYPALMLHIQDLQRAKRIMEIVRDACEVMPVFKNEAVTQMYEMVMYNMENNIETLSMHELPFFETTPLPRENHINRNVIEVLLSQAAKHEVTTLEHK